MRARTFSFMEIVEKNIIIPYYSLGGLLEVIDFWVHIAIQTHFTTINIINQLKMEPLAMIIY